MYRQKRKEEKSPVDLVSQGVGGSDTGSGLSVDGSPPTAATVPARATPPAAPCAASALTTPATTPESSLAADAAADKEGEECVPDDCFFRPTPRGRL